MEGKNCSGGFDFGIFKMAAVVMETGAKFCIDPMEKCIKSAFSQRVVHQSK